MSPAIQPLTSIKTRGHGRRRVASALIRAHKGAAPPTTRPETCPLRIVCISDTHNRQPKVPLGDVLIHAGDLTENGSFQEMQDGLTWLSSQPHPYKVFVAGNHDVLLDDAFLDKYPERRYGQTHGKQDLDWGSVIYLQDSAVSLEFPPSEQGQVGRTEDAAITSLTIFGSPWTPQYGISAFQYLPSNSRHWEDVFASADITPHIVVTHGPPYLHLDRRDFHRAGCPYLAEEVYRIRPRLHVFGHIHASYGREDVVLDGVQRTYEEVMTGWAGWASLVGMAIVIAWARVERVLRGPGQEKTTTFVNAAVVGGPHNELQNAPTVIEMY
ncbi:phosphoesterase [Ophiocordyceps sinensis CO18]|uniref:Phosphoesterase n=1 Tax=Ophiocordyceps sinensis (strain Co18 / CGMCC 3.14243) TaxID=911162 RepID=T5A2E4_OPHSC|nr:phosphoesterase [Ophiocordyceps sinensis CO18]